MDKMLDFIGMSHCFLFGKSENFVKSELNELNIEKRE